MSALHPRRVPPTDVSHNPRAISTALFLMLARLLGARADRMIGGLLSAFSQLDRLPTRRLTACFQAVAARKPAAARY
ncbi:MAG: hypothetical protein IPM24_00385 [Bryobacterales bacterium]|nr:hypothetical protein [Bryobacterales bacterium]